MIRQGILSFFFFVIVVNVFSQSDIDSLKHELETHSARDTLRIKLLHRLTVATSRINFRESGSYANEAYQLSKELRYARGEAESAYMMGG